MPPKLSTKRSPAPTPTEVADPSPKPSRMAWKTEEQLEHMVTYWGSFLTHQNAGTLERFWPRVYDGWYQRWPITPSSESIKEHGSRENAILALRSENNNRIRTWFHNRSRPGSKSTNVGSGLRLNQGEKRKLAPAQAYCNYAWGSGLRDIVVKRWEEENSTRGPAGEDDSTADPIETPASGSHVPIDFKLKIAKEIYDSLSAEEKKKIDDHREEEYKKKSRSVSEITDIEEKNQRLLMHKQKQPGVAKSLLRVLKNLEDQAGCIAQLFVGYVDPQTGKTNFQKFCQGKTEIGLTFQEWCGDEWEDDIEGRFKDWGLRVFGGRGSDRRSKFLLSDTSSGGGETGAAASCSGPSRTTVNEELADGSLEGDTTMFDEDEAIRVSSITSLPQIPKALQGVPPHTPIPPPLIDQPSAVGTHPVNVLPTVTKSSTITPTATSQPFTTNQVVVSPVVLEPTHPVAPFVLESSLTIAPNQTLISPIVHETASLINPVLGPGQVATPNKPAIFPAVHNPASSITSVLESSQGATPSHTANSTTVHESPYLVTLSPALESSQAAAQQAIVSQNSASQRQVTHPPHVIGKPQPAVVHISSDLAGGITADDAKVATKGVYKLRDKISAAEANQTRRDSIDGVPDVVLSLGRSGYEVVDPSPQRETVIRSTEDDTNIPSSTFSFTTPSSTPLPDDLVVPSSQQSLEEYLTIPAEVGTVTSISPAADQLTDRSSPQSVEEPLAVLETSKTTAAATKRFRYAPRAVPAYNIDRSDFPSWLTGSKRIDRILDVEGGKVWGKLIATWIKQERRLSFGERTGARFPLKDKPAILADYFRWRHSPSKGNDIVLPEFGDEVSAWWMSIQPEWRYKEDSDQRDHSYILAGGNKGVFLLIMCLAWWDQAHGRDLEKEKAGRREAAKAAGMDEAAIDFSDLQEHEHKWFNIVNDLIFVMELAQGWQIPGESTPGAVEVTRGRRKRAAEQDGSSSQRKKGKTS